MFETVEHRRAGRIVRHVTNVFFLFAIDSSHETTFFSFSSSFFISSSHTLRWFRMRRLDGVFSFSLFLLHAKRSKNGRKTYATVECHFALQPTGTRLKHFQILRLTTGGDQTFLEGNFPAVVQLHRRISQIESDDLKLSLLTGERTTSSLPFGPRQRQHRRSPDRSAFSDRRKILCRRNTN